MTRERAQLKLWPVAGIQPVDFCCFLLVREVNTDEFSKTQKGHRSAHSHLLGEYNAFALGYTIDFPLSILMEGRNGMSE